MENKPLLSICIPTWNRAKYLEQSLMRFAEQVKDINHAEIEIYVSDNCSDDNTKEIVENYIVQGLPITYSRNEQNLGAALNFVKCMQWASGKYIYLLGDDDVLKKGAIDRILNALRGNDYGLLHIHKFNNLAENVIEYNNPEEFLKQISFWITFMSGSVFRKDIVKDINPEAYIKTHLLQMPYYISSVFSKQKNLILNENLLNIGLDSSANGGYNFYEVFVKNYLDIWKIFVDRKMLSNQGYEYIKKDIYLNFIVGYNYKLLICHQNVMDENKDYIGNRNGFKIAGAIQILEDYYGGEWYHKLYWWWIFRIWLQNKKSG